MRTLVPLVLAAIWLAAPATRAQAQGQSAGDLFTARCANCHTIPDPSLRTDLAWLDQINRTT